MSHKAAPPLTWDQLQFEAYLSGAMKSELAYAGHTVGFGRDKDGKYHAAFARLAWEMWQAAIAPERERFALHLEAWRVNNRYHADLIDKLRRGEAT